MQAALLIVFYFITPILINFLCYRFSLLKKVGAILIAYLLGLIVGNIGIFPEASLFLRELIANKNIDISIPYLQELVNAGTLAESDLQYYSMYSIQDLMTTITIAFALPLLLLSLNIRAWFKVAGKTFLSLVLGLVSVLIPITIGFFIFRNHIDETWKVAGMMTGVYSGGTPNLASIQKALDVDNLTYILTHTYDLIIGAFFLLFVMSIGQRVLLRFLPKYKSFSKTSANEIQEVESSEEQSFFYIMKKTFVLPLLAALGIAIVIIGISVGVGELIPKDFQMMVIILTITTLSILASLIKRINRIQKTFDVGMYFILVFSLVVASMADLRSFSSSHLHIFYWVFLVYAGSLIIHVALAALFKIDADNVIIVSTALTCSPPFVPVVAGALKNKEIIISGITVGIIGYAIGNYLGVFIAYLFKSLPL
ncbi:MAG: DUF819 family protein [Bacteroidetes bacterium]|nr:DUF819 family protein [Bacteroidota bacterium]